MMRGQANSSASAEKRLEELEELHIMFTFLKKMPVHKLVLMSQGKFTEEMLEAALNNINQ